MRTTCLLLLLLLMAAPCFAQQPAAPAAYTQADSVAALRRFFQHKRQLGAFITTGLLAAPVAAGVAASKEPGPLDRGLAYALGVPLAAALPAGSWLFHRQYNHRHEERAVQALQSGQLPASLRRRLKPVYFRR